MWFSVEEDVYRKEMQAKLTDTIAIDKYTGPCAVNLIYVIVAARKKSEMSNRWKLYASSDLILLKYLTIVRGFSLSETVTRTYQNQFHIKPDFEAIILHYSTGYKQQAKMQYDESNETNFSLNAVKILADYYKVANGTDYIPGPRKTATTSKTKNVLQKSQLQTPNTIRQLLSVSYNIMGRVCKTMRQRGKFINVHPFLKRFGYTLTRKQPLET